MIGWGFFFLALSLSALSFHIYSSGIFVRHCIKDMTRRQVNYANCLLQNVFRAQFVFCLTKVHSSMFSSSAHLVINGYLDYEGQQATLGHSLDTLNHSHFTPHRHLVTGLLPSLFSVTHFPPDSFSKHARAWSSFRNRSARAKPSIFVSSNSFAHG